MGLSQYTPIAMSMLNFNIDGNLDMGAYKIKVNHIGESTAAHGVVIDNTLTASDGLKADHIGEVTAAHGVVIDNVLKFDHGAENTAGHWVWFDTMTSERLW
jgi:hypothetical protein